MRRFPCTKSGLPEPNRAARIFLNEGHIRWADTIFVMEKSHLARLREKFADALNGKTIVTLHVRDEYQFMQEELIAELESKVLPHLDPI